jgi:hypothetical protein
MDKNEGKYIGDKKKGKRHGFGRCELDDGEKYSGYWKNGKKHGLGFAESNFGICYMGRFTDGEYGNFGTLYPAEGNRELVLTSGQFSKGAFNGIGLILNEHGGSSYAGQLAESGTSGVGCWYHPDGRIVAGQKTDAKGYAVTLEIYPNGSHGVMHWKNGKLHGDTIKWAPEGTMSVYKYEYGELIDPVTIYRSDGTIITGIMDDNGFQGEVLFIYNGGYNVRKNFKDGKAYGDVTVTGPDTVTVTISQKEAKKRGI